MDDHSTHEDIEASRCRNGSLAVVVAANNQRCPDVTRMVAKGITLTILIAICWAGTLHILKMSFHNQRYGISSNGDLDQVPQRANGAPTLSDLIDSNEELDDDFFNVSESTVQSIPFATRPHETHSSPSASPSNSPSSTSVTPSPEHSSPFPDFASRAVARDKFDAPFFSAWFCSIWNVLFLPIYTIVKLFSCCFQSEKTSTKNILVDSIHHLMERGMTPVQFFVRCGFFCTLWIITMYLVIFTLRTLDTTVVMALFSVTVTLIYMLSWVVLHHQFVGIRIVAVIICDTGIALLAYMDGANSRTLGCVVLAAAAATGDAVYKVFYQRKIGYASIGEMSMFFSLIGFLNAFLMWPMVLLLYFTGAEVLFWDHIPWLSLSMAAALNLCAVLLGSFGLYWTNSVFLSLGILFAIPICAVMDATIYEVTFKGMKLGGIILLMIGLLVVLLPDNWNQYLADILRKRLAKWKRNEQLKKNGARVQDTATAQLSRLRTPSGRVK